MKAATLLKKGETANFDGALMIREEVEACILDRSFRNRVTPLLTEPRDLSAGPLNLELAAISFLSGVVITLLLKPSR